MVDKQSAPRVLFPRTIAEALEYTRTEPEAEFWAGGTKHSGDADRERDFVDLPKVIISLSLVEELARASRSEHSLEIGSMMSLDRLASIGYSALPPGLPDVLAGIGTRPLRCRATVGGNLASTGRRGDLVPLLQMLDTKVEVRYLRDRRGRRKPVPTVRKLPFSVLEEEGGFHRGDLLTRISIPTGQWNFALAEKLPPAALGEPELIFQAVARVEKDTLVDWRMIFWDGRGPLLRSMDIETSLAGSPLPMPRRYLDDLKDAVTKITAAWENRHIDRDAAVRLAESFMRRAAG